MPLVESKPWKALEMFFQILELMEISRVNVN
jgi:hypothetical protein